MKPQPLPYGNYIYRRRIKYDHGHQSIESPYDWDSTYGSEIYESNVVAKPDIGLMDNRFVGFDIFALTQCIYCGGTLTHNQEFKEYRQEWRRGDSVICERCC